jgi:putative MATE family efflux protein
VPALRETDRQILALALPAIATLAAEPLYDITDTAILGHLGTEVLAGAIIATNLLLMASAVFIFLMFGTTATVSRFLGAGEPDEAAIHGIGGLWLGAAIGVVVALIMLPLGQVLIGWWGATGATADAASTYFNVSLLGFPAFLMMMAGTGYVRGGGNTRTPFVVAIATVAGNLALELVLIYGLDLGVGASAGATVVAKWAGAITYAVLVSRSARQRGVPLRPHRRAIRQLSATGWPCS